MSSILKALKKIDETSQPSQTFPSLPEAIDAKKAVTAGVKKRWFFRRWVTAALILLVVAAAGVILLQRRSFFRTRPQPHASSTAMVASRADRAVFRSKIRTAPAGGANTRTGGKSSAPMSAKPKATAGRRAKLTPTGPASAGQPLPQASSVSRVNPRATSGVRKTPFKPKTTFSPPAVADKSVSGKRTRTRQTVTRPPKAAHKKTAGISSYDRLGSSVLKLQALAWSNDAARRLAVINGHVLHEGEAVEGYQVIQIRQQDVIVNDGRKSWRLVFGLQQ